MPADAEVSFEKLVTCKGQVSAPVSDARTHLCLGIVACIAATMATNLAAPDGHKGSRVAV